MSETIKSESMTSEIMLVKAGSLNRRQFLAATGGLLLAFTLPSSARGSIKVGGIKVVPITLATLTTGVNALIYISTDESITILVGNAEMGQGAMSGLAQFAAEELRVDWSRVKVQPAPASLSWVTGGSSSIRGHFKPMQLAGATAREMLIAAAAATWGVPASACQAAHGAVLNTKTNASLTYGALATAASQQPVPPSPPLTPSSAFQIVGKPVPRPDLPAKTDGSAVYGIDVRLPGMVYAVIKHCPSLGGTVQGTPRTPSGALAVVPLGTAVAVVASDTWQALQAADQLEVGWNIPATARGIDSGVISTQAQQMMAGGAAVTAEQQGGVAGAFAAAAHLFEATYSLPYLAHACMEVLNCTVRLSPAGCEVWAPTQAPGSVAATAAALTGLPPSKIQVNPTLLGGGLGRKIEQDYISQAIRVAQAVGKPVKLTWPREEDMGRDQYRPTALVRVRAGLDPGGNILGWAYRHVSPSILFQRGYIPDGVNDGQATEGATGLSYAFGARLVEYVRHPAAVPVGFWRSVGHSINAFAVESAIDEIAQSLGADPLAYRQRLLANDPRSLAVLNAATSLGGWGSALPAGHARGLAFAASFGSIVAQVAEISQPVPGAIKVHKVSCVIDCGTAINPDSVEAQMESGIHHGLSAALWGQVTFQNGQASARNFSNYRMLRLSESPAIAVQIIQSGAPLGGVGEPGVPPVAPAIANAYARLTKQRVRTLPFFPGARMSGD